MASRTGWQALNWWSWRTKRKLFRQKMTIGQEEVENLAGQNAEKPRQSKNKCSSAWSDKGPVETAADQVETDSAVESRGRCQAHLQRSADFPWFGKESEQETNWRVKWQRSYRHVRQKCSRQNPCHPARFVLNARDDVLSGPMTCWAVPWRIDKGPIPRTCQLYNSVDNTQSSTLPKRGRFPCSAGCRRTSCTRSLS